MRHETLAHGHGYSVGGNDEQTGDSKKDQRNHARRKKEEIEEDRSQPQAEENSPFVAETVGQRTPVTTPTVPHSKKTERYFPATKGS